MSAHMSGRDAEFAALKAERDQFAALLAEIDERGLIEAFDDGEFCNRFEAAVLIAHKPPL